MKKIFFLLLLSASGVFVAHNSNAQAVVNRSVLMGRDGKPLAVKEYTDVEGSPYLSKDWGDGTVTFTDGETLKGVKLKFDMVENALYFTDKPGGQSFGFNKPVNEFLVTYTEDDQQVTKHFKRGFNGISRTTADSFFEVLADGTVQLLKRNNMGVVMTTIFNSASTTKNFKDDIRYYLVINGKGETIKNDPKAIIAKLPADKQQKLTDYVKTNNLKKNDADLGKLVTYYNSL